MKIACILITHLPMKSELIRRPDLQNRPVIITEGSDSKEVVLDSSPEARNIIPGMPLQEAMSRIRSVVLLRADVSYYEIVFNKVIFSLCQRSPLVEKSVLGCAYISLDGLEQMYGSEARLITSIINAVPNHLNPRVGIANGKFLAYVAALSSRGGQTTKVPDGATSEFLKNLTIDTLPLPWKDRIHLHRFGIHTIGQIKAVGLGPIQAQFGISGRRAWELANGRDHSPLVPYKTTRTVTDHLIFPTPTVTLDALLIAIDVLLGRVFAKPLLKNRYVRMATLEAKVMLNTPWVRNVVFRNAVGNKKMASSALHAALTNIALPGPLEDLSLTLSGLTGESGIQTSLFSNVRRQKQLREIIRHMEARFRTNPPIFKVKDIEPWSRIPERRQSLVQFDP